MLALGAAAFLWFRRRKPQDGGGTAPFLPNTHQGSRGVDESAVERKQLPDAQRRAIAFWLAGTPTDSTDASNSRFTARMLRTGPCEEATRSLWDAMGVEEGTDKQQAIVRDGCKAIEKEFRENGQEDLARDPRGQYETPGLIYKDEESGEMRSKDEFGSDQARLEYVLNGAAVESRQKNGADPPVRDKGHAKMTLDGFCAKREADGLKKAHVLALRLYTSNSYVRINNPLRWGPKPHPFPATTYYVASALKQLRKAHAKAGIKQRFFWRGLDNMGANEDFFAYGGTEMGCMSTTGDENVARDFAKVGDEPNPLLLKIESNDLMSCGADISWLSMYPAEKEVLFPPLTYLRPKKVEGQAVELNGRLDRMWRKLLQRGESDCTIITVVPSFPS
jgi:hypothetical protein